jgi:hypothetical protein
MSSKNETNGIHGQAVSLCYRSLPKSGNDFAAALRASDQKAAEELGDEAIDLGPCFR